MVYKLVPVSQLGHARGLFVYAFGIFVVVVLAAALRTTAVVVLALTILVLTFFSLGAGPYGATTLVHGGGYFGLAAAACALYLALAELCEFSDHRAVLPVWALVNPPLGPTQTPNGGRALTDTARLLPRQARSHLALAGPFPRCRSPRQRDLTSAPVSWPPRCMTPFCWLDCRLSFAVEADLRM